MARIRMSVSFDLPEGASREEALTYVVDAVSSWKGSLRPDGWDGPGSEGDPMFYLDDESVEATTAVTRKNRRKIIRCRSK